MASAEDALAIFEVLGDELRKQFKRTGKILSTEANIKFYQVQRRNAINQLGEHAYKNRNINMDIIKKIEKLDQTIKDLEGK